MSTIQDQISNKTSKLKRHLFDYKVRLSGNCTGAIRLKIDENRYGDETITVICHNRINAIINYPTEIPFYRIRGEVQQVISEPTGTYLYDILPIELFTQFKDDVEKGDLIIRKIKDEHDECILHVLRITEILGAFKTNIVWKKSQCAPYNMILTSEIINIINKY